VTNIPGKTAHLEQVRSKKPWSGMSKLLAVQPLWLNFRPLYYGIWLFRPPWGSEGGENIVKSSYLNLPDIGVEQVRS
jgi:hypothetical protein